MKHWYFGAAGLAIGVAIGMGGAMTVPRLRPGDGKPVEIAKLSRTHDGAGVHDSASMPEHRGEIDAGDLQLVDYTSLGNEVQIIGQLGTPLLHLLKIEGTRFVYPDDVPAPKAADWEIYFDVTRLNGEALAAPMRILLDRWSLKHRAEIPPGEPMVLEGYEDGGFSGVFDIKNDPHHKYRNMAAGSPRHFSVEFFVLDAKPLKKATAKTGP